MIDTRQMATLLDWTDRHAAQLVLVGDADQLPAIGPGGMFRAIQDRVEPTRLQTMRRQQNPDAAAATRAFRDQEAARALAAYQAMGTLHVAPAPDLLGQLVGDWFHARTATSLMMASTRHQVFHLNRLARQTLQEHGHLPADQFHVATTFGDRAVAVGDQILLRKNDYHRQVRNGDRGTISGLILDPTGTLRVQVKLGTGRRITFNPEEYPHWDWGYATTLHQAQGQTVDRAFWLVSPGDHASHAYVATSRARQQTDLYIDAQEWAALDHRAAHHQALTRLVPRLNRPGQKTLAHDDYTPILRRTHS